MQVRFRALTTKRLMNIPAIEVEATALQLKHATNVMKHVRWYPPQPAAVAMPRKRQWVRGQFHPTRASRGYVRTYKLYRGWEVWQRRTREGLITTVTNKVPYAHWVHGKDQYWLHTQTGWRRLAVNLRRDEYLAGLKAIYKKHLRST